MGIVAVIWSPVRTLREVAGRHSALPGFIVVAVYAVMSLAISAAFVLSGATRRQLQEGLGRPGQSALPPGVSETVARTFEIGAPIAALLSPFLIWFLVSLLMQLATRLFGGTGPLSSMLGVVGVAQAPFIVGGILGALLSVLQLWIGAGTPFGVAIGYLVSLVGLAFFVWYVVLVVVGAAQARGVGYGESAGSCALSCVGLGGLIILLVVVAGIGIFIVAGAAAPQ